MRPLNAIDGQPAVIVAAHPVKGADRNNLIPFGGGAILNEVDGNLCLTREPGFVVALHWQGKLRGDEFEAIPFCIEALMSPDVVDAKGKTRQIPVLKPTSKAEVERKAEADTDLDVSLLRAIAANEGGSLDDWGAAINRKKSSVGDRLNRLKTEKLVDGGKGRWWLAPNGVKVAETGRK